MFVGAANDFAGAGNAVESWAGAGAIQRQPRRAQGEPPTRLPRAVHFKWSSASNSVVGVRRLAHALDGVKILQRLHAGQRLRTGHERDIPGELGAMQR